MPRLGKLTRKTGGAGERGSLPQIPRVLSSLSLFSRRPNYLRAWHRLPWKGQYFTEFKSFFFLAAYTKPTRQEFRMFDVDKKDFYWIRNMHFSQISGFFLTSTYLIACKANDFFSKIVQFVRALSSDVRSSMRASLPHVIRDEKEEENFQRLSPAPLHVLTLAPDLSV